jgi:nitroreductase
VVDILDVLFSRRSIRTYTNQPVEKELLLQLLQAAMAAPSASDGRPCEFVVVTRPEIMDQFRSNLKYGNYNAPAAIIVCYNQEISRADSSKRYWVQDCSAAVENILISAAGLGLGTVWIGGYPQTNVISTARRILSLPESVIPQAIVYVGYPAESKPSRTQYEDRRIHWESYQ